MDEQDKYKLKNENKEDGRIESLKEFLVGWQYNADKIGCEKDGMITNRT